MHHVMPLGVTGKNGFSRLIRSDRIRGMITGTIATIVWKLWLKDPTGIYELIPEFVGSTLMTVVVSLSSQGRNR